MSTYIQTDVNSMLLPNINSRKIQRNLTRKNSSILLKNLPKLNKLGEPEMVSGLSLDTLPNNNYSDILVREKIDNDIEIINKRLGKKEEKKKFLTKEQEQEEIKSNQSREFFIKYEMMRREKEWENEIKDLQNEIDNIKDQKNKLINEIMQIFKNIYNYELDLNVLENDMQYQSQKNDILSNDEADEIETKTVISVSGKKRKRKKKMDDFIMKTLQIQQQEKKKKEKELIIEQKQNQIDAANNLKNKVNEKETLLKEKKSILKEKITKLSNYYHKKLYEGLDVRQEGLSWIIKAIWNLGENIKMSYFPNFLDNLSINYLFKIAHKQVQINIIKEKIDKNRKDLDQKFMELNNKEKFLDKRFLFRTSITEQIKSNQLPKTKLHTLNTNKESVKIENVTLKSINKVFQEENPYSKLLKLPSVQKISDLAIKSNVLEYEVLMLKQEEMNRIFKEFLENNYEKKYNVIIDVVIAALVGEGKRDHELIKFYKLKKEINDNMRSIQYYKIITKKRILKKKKKEDEEDDMIDKLLNEIEKNAEEKE